VVLQGGFEVLHIFINGPRGSVVWLDSAKNFEEAKSKAKKFYADQPAEYFAYDGYTRAKFVFAPEQLGHQAKTRST
jgi:hypothetical protein